jgi:CDGSH-type Zn-finger protein
MTAGTRGQEGQKKEGMVTDVSVVRVIAEGPLLVRGPIRLLDEEGNEVPIRRRINAICRCGRSVTQPFCDGTHKIVPFSPRAVRAAASE